MSKSILYIVDVQRDFMPFQDSNLPVPGGDNVIVPINNLLSSLDPDKISFIVVSEDAHDADFVELMPDGSPFPSHCVKGTKGSETVVDLSPVPNNIPILGIRKNAFNVWEEDTLPVFNFRDGTFINTTRDILFQNALKNNIVDVILVGVCSDVCVKDAGIGLLKRGFNITIPRDCVKGLFREIDEVNATDWNSQATLI